MTLLKERFFDLWTRCSVPNEPSTVQDIWKEITTFYGESHRAYHTLDHIKYCLNALDQAQGELEHSDAVELSIWFHDIIFHPGQPDNEIKSTDYFVSISSGFLPASLIAHVSGLIMATRHHHHNIEPPETLDSQFMVDIDLSSFGLDEKAFEQNTRDLRREQSTQSDEEFNRSTAAFFRSLLQRERIFYTAYFYDQLEEKARQNIFLALKKLGEPRG